MDRFFIDKNTKHNFRFSKIYAVEVCDINHI